MTFEEDDEVVLHDEHSEEQGVPEDNLEAAEE